MQTQFLVGEEYLNQNGGERRFIVVEVRNGGHEGLLRNVATGGEIWKARDDIMQTPQWRYDRPPRFEVGRYFVGVDNPQHRALVAEVSKEGPTGLIRFVNERGERFRDESWFVVNDFFGGGEWRLPPHDAS